MILSGPWPHNERFAATGNFVKIGTICGAGSDIGVRRAPRDE